MTTTFEQSPVAPDTVASTSRFRTAHVASLLLFAACCALASIYWAVGGPIERLDRRLVTDAQSLSARSNRVADMSTAVSWLGSTSWLAILVVGGAAALVARGRRRDAVWLVATGAGAGALNRLMKLVIDRARPAFDDPVALETSASFPSGHAMGSAAVYGALVVLGLAAWNDRTRLVAMAGAAAVAIAVALSRVFLGVHYPSDVIVGLLLGTAWLLAMSTIVAPRVP
jgi:membrane-associated phospholipid phosphatase